MLSGARSSVISLLTSGIVLALGTLLGRLTGFVREALIVTTFGLDETADVVVFTLTIPDLMVNLVVGGALAAVLIPELQRRNETDRRKLLVQASVLLGAAGLTFAGLAGLAAEPLTRLLAPGFDGATLTTAAMGLRVSLFVIPLTMTAAVTAAFLHGQERFGVASMATPIYNGLIIGTLLLIVPTLPQDMSVLVVVVALGAIAGGAFRWLSQIVAIRCHSSSVTPTASAEPGWLIDRQMLRRYAEALGGASIILLLPVFARALASLSDSGALAALNLSLKLVELPLGISTSVLAVVIFPRIARALSQDDHAAGEKLMRTGVDVTMAMALALTIPLVWFAMPITGLAFGWGAVQPNDVEQVARLAAIGFVAIPAQGLSALLLVAFYARRDTRTPFRVSFATVAAFAPLGAAGHLLFGLEGVAAAVVATQLIVFGGQAVALRRAHGVNVVKIAFDREGLRVFGTGLMAFLPFGFAGYWLELDRVWGSAVGIAAGATMLFAMALSSSRFRTFSAGVRRRR